MTGFFVKYRIALIIAAIIATALIGWYFIIRDNSSRIPSRGVFVIEQSSGVSVNKIKYMTINIMS